VHRVISTFTGVRLSNVDTFIRINISLSWFYDNLYSPHLTTDGSVRNLTNMNKKYLKNANIK